VGPVLSLRTEDLDQFTRAAIIKVCIAAHQEEDFKNLFTYIPSGGRHFLAYQEDELVSHAVVTTRWLQPEGHPILRTAYVDAVATLPIYQGQGYGSAVMRQLAKEIDEQVISDDYAIACLETDKPGFYTRLGWEQWRGPLAGRSAEGLVPTPEQTGIMVLRLARTPPLDLDRGLTIECQSGRIW
jgi:aminoglycoside 2'-N-acetyltransferase I